MEKSEIFIYGHKYHLFKFPLFFFVQYPTAKQNSLDKQKRGKQKKIKQNDY